MLNDKKEVATRRTGKDPPCKERSMDKGPGASRRTSAVAGTMSSENSYVEALSSNVTVFGDWAFKEVISIREVIRAGP